MPLGEHRRLAVAHVELERVKAIREALGGTVNDVVLALVTAGLRRLLLARDEIPPARGPARDGARERASAAAPAAELGNQVSSLFVALPVDEPDPAERFRRVHAEAGRRKAGHQAAGGRALIELGALAPPVAALADRAPRVRHAPVQRHGDQRARARRARSTRSGASCAAIIPLVPLAAEHAVGVAITSYAGDLCVCVNADRDLVRDVDELIAGMRPSSTRSRRSPSSRRRCGRCARVAATTNASVHAASTAAPAPGARRCSTGQSGERVAGLAGQVAADRRRGGEEHGVDRERVGGQRDDRADLVADQRADRDAEHRAEHARGAVPTTSASDVAARQRDVDAAHGEDRAAGAERDTPTQTAANSDAGERGRGELRGEDDAPARLDEQRRADRAVAELAGDGDQAGERREEHGGDRRRRTACAASPRGASSAAVGDRPSTQAPSRVSAAAASRSTATVRVVRSFSSSERSWRS